MLVLIEGVWVNRIGDRLEGLGGDVVLVDLGWECRGELCHRSSMLGSMTLGIAGPSSRVIHNSCLHTLFLGDIRARS